MTAISSVTEFSTRSGRLTGRPTPELGAGQCPQERHRRRSALGIRPPDRSAAPGHLAASAALPGLRSGELFQPGRVDGGDPGRILRISGRELRPVGETRV
ncbi:hypothetical protein GCM10010518_54440 [Kitasatospora cinereorecta]